MPNWTSITIDDLKANSLGFVVDKARTTASGDVDVAGEAIGQAVARVRRAITGSPLDADTTTVPMSLKGVAVRMALYTLMERIRLPLSDDQRETRKADTSDLLRLSDKRIPVERPDNGAGTAEMSPPSGIVIVNAPTRLTGRERTSGL